MAQLDASLILAGRPLDVVGAMRQGNAAAMETNALRQQNQLANVYQTQGAGLLAGDQGALNALARVDPAAAFSMRGAQQDFQMNARKMEILNAEEKRAIAQAAAQMDAAQKEAAIAEIEGAVKMGLAIQSPEQWDAMMAQNAPELVGQFANRQALAQKYMTMAEALKASAPAERPAPMTDQGKAAFDAQNGYITPEQANAPAPTADNQTERDIALLGEVGIPRDQAIRITQLYTVARDPQTGEQVLLDKSTGRPVDGQALAQPAQAAPTAVQQPQPAANLSFGPQFEAGPNVFGMEGFAKGMANTLTDVIPGIGTAFPEEMRTESDFRVLREQLVNDVASAYDRQPPSWLLQNIQELAPTPGKITEGPDQAIAKLSSLGRALQQEMALIDQQLGMRMTPDRRQPLEARRAGLEMAISRISIAAKSLKPQSGANKTSSGVTWSIE